MGKRYYLIFGIVIALAIVSFAFFSNRVSSFETLSNYQGDIKIYKSGSCGCCGIYADYFQKKGNSNAEIVIIENLDLLKKNYNIPSQLESCHTSIIGDYFIEGHVPLEAVEKLLQERPNIAGIAMPGMPDGSPGMLGSKTSDFIIYAVNNDGSYEEFIRL